MKKDLKTNTCELYKDGQQMSCEYFINYAVLAAARAIIEGFLHMSQLLSSLFVFE